MSYFSETYLNNIRSRMGDFISNDYTGQMSNDIVLEYTNRAQKSLWTKKPWEDLAVDIDVSLVNNSYSLPVDFGRVIWVYADLYGNGSGGYMLWNSLDYEGYKIRNAFTKSYGHSLTLSFKYEQTNSVKMIYQKLLSDFTGEGDEYLFFPSNIMLLEAQKIALREKGDIKEFQMVENTFNKEFNEFVNSRQWVNKNPINELRDSYGNIISIGKYSLDGDISEGGIATFDRKTLSL